ncbi:MAG: serine/threonine protein kinase, partial [Planctomycetes bacterium]|nr:serine/threonine protein kinase [Planctomycetota bacterium]
MKERRTVGSPSESGAPDPRLPPDAELSPDQWLRAKQAFGDALELEATARPALLESLPLPVRQLVKELLADVEGREATSSFLEPPTLHFPDSHLFRIPGSPAKDLGHPGQTIARRYELEARTGRGAAGEVFRAEDRLTRTSVAVKLLRGFVDVDELASVRSEVAALRLLRLPGVVRMLDEGVDADPAFIVMDWVEGRPFPGRSSPVPWSELAPVAVGLLEALQRVHLAGFLHGDLKPSNVFVDGNRVTILDLGLARAVASRLDGATPSGGTPAYLAPELFAGADASPQSDLYAVGVMLHEALTGRSPHTGRSLPEIVRDRREREVRLDPSDGIPDFLADLVTALLARDPAERPRDVGSALQDLGDSTLESRVEVIVRQRLADGGASSAAELRPLFQGPERLLHLPSDAADELWRRSDGDRSRIVAELSRWVRAGLATPVEDRLAATRDSIDRLQREGVGIEGHDPHADSASRRSSHRLAAERLPVGSEDRLARWIAAGATREVVEASLERAEALRREGRHGLAFATLEAALPVARSSRPALAAMLRALVLAAHRLSTPVAFDRALYQLEITEPLDDDLERLATLARGGLAILQRGGQRSLALIDGIPPFEDLELELQRQRVRASATRLGSIDAQREALHQLESWAED